MGIKSVVEATSKFQFKIIPLGVPKRDIHFLRIKIVMAYRRTILRDESQTVGHSLLLCCSPMLNPSYLPTYVLSEYDSVKITNVFYRKKNQYFIFWESCHPNSCNSCIRFLETMILPKIIVLSDTSSLFRFLGFGKNVIQGPGRLCMPKWHIQYLFKEFFFSWI